MQLPAKRLDEVAERSLVAGAGGVEQRALACDRVSRASAHPSRLRADEFAPRAGTTGEGNREREVTS